MNRACRKACPRGSAAHDPETYDNFKSGDCGLVLLVVDREYVTMYVKDEALLARLYEHVRRLRVIVLAYVTDGNDFRTRLRIW